MTDYKASILSILLDWYENSPAYARGETPARRRILRLYDNGKTDFSAYNIEDYNIRNEVNRAVADMAAEGYIEYEWLRGQRDHIIAKLWLIAGAVERAYAALERQPKSVAAEDALDKLSVLLHRTQTEWARNWCADAIAAITRRRSIGAILPQDEAERQDLLKAVSCLADSGEVEMLERVFSIRCFGDSKHFERVVKNRLAGILRKYLAQDECTDEEALRLAGIVQYPEQFIFSGALRYKNAGETVDFTSVPSGGTLTIDDLTFGKVMACGHVNQIISIENRANYIDYVRKMKTTEELILYHGGQFSPAKRIFLAAVASSMPEGCRFFHWGDIDYGGFHMLARLRREICPDVKPWKMDDGMLIKYRMFATGFSDDYRKRLVSLLDMPELADCAVCIEYMIKNGMRLEQEALLTTI